MTKIGIKDKSYKTMREIRNQFVSALLVFAVLIQCASAQRTYMRSCECEYTQNGQCAYTLLLPVMSDNSATCPTPSPSDSINGNDDVSMSNTTSAQLERRIAQLGDDVNSMRTAMSELTLASGEQSRMLSQLQSKVMEQTDTLNMIQAGMRGANMTSEDGDDCQVCENITQQLDMNSNVSLGLAAQIDEIRTAIAEVHMQLGMLVNDTELEETNSRLDGLNQTITSARDSFNDAIESIQARIVDSRQCTTKGLLVSGTTSRIENEAISASSEMENATAEMIRIRNDVATAASAWCPLGRKTYKTLSLKIKPRNML